MMGWLEVVAAARASENKEVAALLLADTGLQKLCAAWHLARIEMSPDADDAADIDGVLGSMRVDAAHLATLTGMQAILVMKSLERAVALRLVYPDGSLHALVKTVLHKQIKDALSG